MLVRPAGDALAVYLTRRSSRSRFMPDAYVFPGGAVDPVDRAAAANGTLFGTTAAPDPALAAAALRELFEEAGILLARDAAGRPARPDAAAFAALRTETLAGEPLAASLEHHGLRLDASALTYYSNWITPQSEPIRFDAHFFIARAPGDQVAAADAIEVHDGVWMRPAEALAGADRGEMTVRFPTRKHLLRLARFADIDALLEHARSRTAIAPVMPLARDFDAFELAGGPDAW